MLGLVALEICRFALACVNQSFSQIVHGVHACDKGAYHPKSEVNLC